MTACPLALARARMRAAGLVPPRTLVTAESVERGKPDPAPFLLAARRLGVAPADCVVLEDAPAGIRAGRAAGMTVLALATTHPPGELAEADLVVDDLSAVAASLAAADDARSLVAAA